MANRDGNSELRLANPAGTPEAKQAISPWKPRTRLTAQPGPQSQTCRTRSGRPGDLATLPGRGEA
eukprot:4132658-Pyramimonas_sp.AAC.1